MLLSLIIPAYNAGHFLGNALESVLCQTGREFEILIVDDGSGDDTADVAQEYAGRFSNIRLISSKHRGVSHARNLGLDAAKGTYVAFLDADDVLCSKAYTHEVEALLREESYDIISFAYLHGDESLRWGNMVPEASGAVDSTHPEFRRMVTRKSFCSFLYRREILEGLRFPEGIRYSEDCVFAYMAACRGKNMLRRDQCWFIYRNHVFSAVHKTDGGDYIRTDAIPAWFYAANAVDTPQARWDCWGMVYELTADYLRRRAMSGETLSNLMYALSHHEAIRTVLDHPGTYWTTGKTDRIIHSFRNKPRRTWLKYRFAGIFAETLRKLSRTMPVRYLYFRMRYRLDLTDWR